MEVHELSTVDGHVVFDLDGAPMNAGGTSYSSPDPVAEDSGSLARAMTYRFAVLGERVGGAKAVVRGELEERDEVMARYCEEVRPLVESGRFITGPDIGTSEHHFRPLRSEADGRHVMTESLGGMPYEDVLTGFGVVSAMEAAAGELDGRSILVAGFGRVVRGVVREAVRRGARIVAVATSDGCVADRNGLDVELMISLRRVYGDTFVWHLGLPVDERPAALFELDADVLVPGVRPGVITRTLAERLRCRWIVPAASMPYTAAALEVLQRRRLGALPDFVCNAGAVIGYLQPPSSRPGEVFREVERRIAKTVLAIQADADSPYLAGCRMAEDFLRTWRPEDASADRRPLA